MARSTGVLVPRSEREPLGWQVFVDKQALARLLAPEGVFAYELAGHGVLANGSPPTGGVGAGPEPLVVLLTEEVGDLGGGGVGQAGQDDIGAGVVPDGLGAFPSVAEALLAAVLPHG